MSIPVLPAEDQMAEILTPCKCGYGCPPGDGCRYMGGIDDDPEPQSKYCECNAVHSLGTEEADCGVCSACGGTL